MVGWLVFSLKCRNFKAIFLLCFPRTLYTDKYVNVYGLGGQTYTYHHEEDETTFHLVDTAKMQKPLYQKGRPRFNQVW